MTPFEFHTGFPVLEKTTGDGEKLYETTCALCGKDHHFHFFADWRWGCKVCGEKGNLYTFMRLLWDRCTKNDVSEVAKHRGIPERALVNIRWNKINSTHILATFDNKGEVNNLYKATADYKLLCTPSLNPTLDSWEQNPEQEVWICEGQWDKRAGIAINPSDDPRTWTAIPGALVFKESWCGAYRDKDVILCLDNDDAGEKGTTKIIKTFEESPQKPRSIHRIIWPGTCAEGYDLRDFYLEHGRTSKAWKLLRSYIKPIESKTATKLVSSSVIEDYSCDSYDKALTSFETAFHTTPDMRAALAATMASIYSVTMDSPEQVWLKIIGPPSCGKSSIAKAVSASDYVTSMSTFTGLFSGWSDNSEEDAGMVPLIANRTLVVKDIDPLLKQPNIEQIMSELRDFYDKSSSVRYKNRRNYDYRNVSASIVVCGTQVLRRMDQSFLGERFLSIEMDVSEADKQAICRRAMKKAFDAALGIKKDPEDAIMSAMKGWINHLRDRKLDSTLPEDFQELVIRLCFLTATMRTNVDRDFKGRLRSPSMPEVPARLVGQSTKLALALSAVFGQNSPNEEIYQVVRKALRDTINPRSHRFLLCSLIQENPGIDIFDIEAKLDLAKSTINEEISDLEELNIVTIKRIPSDKAGRQRRGFHLHDNVNSALKELN